MKRIVYLLLLCLCAGTIRAQVGGVQKITSPKRQHYVDSIAAIPYPYVFPVLGDKIRKRGIILPLPHGVMLNYAQGWQLIQLSQLAVGFNGSNKYDLSDMVQFQQVKGEMITPNLRFDTWVLPFLNVYGIAGYGAGKLNVHMSEPFDFQTSTTTNGQYYGVGTMLTGAISGIFLANDYNFNWAFNDKLDHPANVFMTGLRAGPIFRFPHSNRMNISVWGGFTYSHLNSKTEGNIPFSEVFPNAGTDLDQLETKLDNWYTEAYNNAQLPAKKEAIQAVYDRSKEAISNIRKGVETGSIQYTLQKSFQHPFNVVVGAQWQINDTWQLRSEFQFFGDRQLGLLSLNYRFGIKGRTLFSKKS